LINAQKQLSAKNSEIEFLKQQLKQKEDENRALKEDKARILKEQVGTLSKIQSQAAGESAEGSFRIEELDKVLFDAFNTDLTRRSDYVAKMLDWQRFGAVAGGEMEAEPYNPEVQDGELAAEHFTYRKSRLNLLMDKVYFPTIDAQEHLDLYRPSDFAIKLEHEKYHDMILIELVTLQNVLKQLGYDASFSTPGQSPEDECKVSEHDRMILGGLMKRLLN